jgi:branched-chain amino acid transport system permease protein
MQVLIQAIFSGLVNGSVYGLLGMGLVLYFRSARVINLAHGETYVVTALITAAAVAHGWPLWLAALAGVAAAVLAMILIERVLFRGRLHWQLSSLVILSLGVALLARGLFYRIWGSDATSFPEILSGEPQRLFGVSLSQQGLLAVSATMVFGVVATLFFRRTLYGQAMTACAENPEASALLGINVGRMRMISFGAAAVLGGVSALLVVPLGSVTYDAGLPLVLRGFVAAAVGAMLWPGRAAAAGLGLGVLEALVASYWSPLLRTPIVFGVVFTLVVFWLSRNVRFGGVVRA